MTRAFIFDTETTGFKEPQVIQAASTEVQLDGSFSWVKSKFFRNTKPIELGAMATHHLTEETLADYEPWEAGNLLDFVPEGIMIGHNIDFDWEVVGKPPLLRIDTLAIARVLWPEIDSHSQTALLYFAYGSKVSAMAYDAHNAAADVHNLAQLWMDLFLPAIDPQFKASWEGLYAFAEDCRLPRVMSFGKYKGLPVAEVPVDYVLWYMRQVDTDPYYITAFEKTFGMKLKQRRGK